jgi:hypothetical protein
MLVVSQGEQILKECEYLNYKVMLFCSLCGVTSSTSDAGCGIGILGAQKL